MGKSVAYNSFLLLYFNHGDDLRISEYDRSGVQIIISCEWVLSGSFDGHNMVKITASNMWFGKITASIMSFGKKELPVCSLVNIPSLKNLYLLDIRQA